MPGVSVYVSVRKIDGFLSDNMKKDTRLTIRVPKQLKDRIDGIDQVYGVGLPKIANECLRAFCEYVDRMKQTPSFPLSVSPHSRSGGKRKPVSTGRRRELNGVGDQEYKASP